MVGVAENFKVRIILKLRCGLKKQQLATKSCVSGNYFLSGATFLQLAVGTLFWPLLYLGKGTNCMKE